jgi:hypothetical protein
MVSARLMGVAVTLETPSESVSTFWVRMYFFADGSKVLYAG